MTSELEQPRAWDEHLRPATEVVLRIEDVVVDYPVPRSRLKVHAVSGVSLDLKRGETLGLVGETGCGKSTLGRAVLQLPRPNSGTVSYDGVDLTKLSRKELRALRAGVQMIFQDPVASLNPRWSVGRSVSDPLKVHHRGKKQERHERAAEVLRTVNLDPKRMFERRPHQLSGGQSQRVAIARALVLEPAVIVCDEPVSALDVSVQAQILNLLEDMKARYELSLLFISHDLAVVRNISDRVAVMYLGKLCEVGTPEEIFNRPAHPYTDALIRSIPVPEPGAIPTVSEHMSTELPSPVNPPSGCRFRTRCPLATDLCAAEGPVMTKVGDDHFVACHYPLSSGGPVSLPAPAFKSGGAKAV